MIRLNKIAPPERLTKNARQWREEYLGIVRGAIAASDAARRRFAQPFIRARLQRETCNKCAYCESKIAHVTWEHVEHIIPRTAKPELVVEWSNLTLACPKCNNAKGDYHSDTCPLVNPYADDPNEHLYMLGAMIMGKPQSKRGRMTVKKLDLQRSELIERRLERISALDELLAQWATEADPAVKSIYLEEMRRFSSETEEYSATTQSFLRLHGVPV